MFRDMFNFQGINWWTMVGGVGLNFIISLATTMGGAYLGSNPSTADFYTNYGMLIMIMVLFLACGAGGYVVARIADDVPLKHAFWCSLGAAAPFMVSAVLFFSPMQFMLAGVAIAGALNGGILGTPRRHFPPRG